MFFFLRHPLESMNGLRSCSTCCPVPKNQVHAIERYLQVFMTFKGFLYCTRVYVDDRAYLPFVIFQVEHKGERVKEFEFITQVDDIRI